MVVDVSTSNLKELLQNASKEDLYTLMQYNYGKNCSKVAVNVLVKEIKYNGSNNFAYLLRNFEGVEYKEIVCDVAKKLKVKFDKEDSEESIEGLILIRVLEDFWKSASKDERKALKELFEKEGIKNKDFKAGFPLGGLMAIIGLKSSEILLYKLTTIVANTISKQLLGIGLKFAANQGLGKGVAILLGPVGWVVNGLWLAMDIAGPAYRKTIPSVLHIAYIRQKAKVDLLNWEEE